MLGKIRGLWGIQIAEIEQVGGWSVQVSWSAAMEESSQKDCKRSQDQGRTPGSTSIRERKGPVEERE